MNVKQRLVHDSQTHTSQINLKQIITWNSIDYYFSIYKLSSFVFNFVLEVPAKTYINIVGGG